MGNRPREGARSLTGLVVLFLLLLVFIVVAVVVAFSIESASWMQSATAIWR